MVIDNIGEMIGGQLVGTLPKHLVIKDAGVDANIATDDVVHVNVLAWLNKEADYIGVPFSDEALGLCSSQREGIAHLKACGSIVLEVLHFLTLRCQLLWSVESDVCATGIEELLYILLIDVLAFALAVGPMAATEAHTFVELNAQPFEGFKDIVLGTWHKTCGVSVLNTEDEFAAVLTGKEIIIKSRADASDVERSCG